MSASNTSTATARPSQNRELVNPNKFSAEGRDKLAEELRENKYGDKVCTMCSNVGVNHTFRYAHFSTTAIRRLSATSSSPNKTFMCPVCKVLEPVNIPAAESRRVVLADSSLAKNTLTLTPL